MTFLSKSLNFSYYVQTEDNTQKVYSGIFVIRKVFLKISKPRQNDFKKKCVFQSGQVNSICVFFGQCPYSISAAVTLSFIFNALWKPNNTFDSSPTQSTFLWTLTVCLNVPLNLLIFPLDCECYEKVFVRQLPIKLLNKTNKSLLNYFVWTVIINLFVHVW